MSKFLNILAPALGGTAGVLAMAYVISDQFVADIPAIAPRLVPSAAVASETATVTPAAAEATTTAASPVAVAAPMGKFGLGRPATDEEIAAWDVNVMPDGRGLPAGSGDVWTGEEVFADKCASCHGDFAEGVDNWPKLAGGMDTLDHEDPLKTVGSYWPYLSTVWDYVNRSMPFGAAQTLETDEVYAIVAYILYSNDLVDDDFTLSHENFLDVDLPNAGGFIVDDRLTSEAHFITEPCMENCKDTVEITMRARVLDVTPDEGDDDTAAAAEAPVTTAAVATTEPAAEPAVADAVTEPAVTEAALDPAMVSAGEGVFKKCKACHMVGDKAKNRTGPHLNAVFGRTAGTVEGFRYSKPMIAAGEEGLVWTDETMAAFLAKPKEFIKKTKMSFNGLKKEDDDIAAVSAYLKSFGE